MSSRKAGNTRTSRHSSTHRIMLERTGNHPRTPPSSSPMNRPLPLTPGATERLPAIARTPPAVPADKSWEHVDTGAASGTIGGAPFTDTAEAGALCPANDSPESIMSRLQNYFFSEKDTMKKRHEEQLTALTLQNSALEEEMQHSKIMYARRNTEYDLLLQGNNALQQKLEQRPEAIKRLERTLCDSSKPPVSNLLNGMKHFVGDSIVQLLTDGDSATLKIALEEMAAPFPKHVEMMTTIQETKDHMLKIPTAISTGDEVKEWPEREAVDALGLLPVLQTAVTEVEEAAFPKLIAALNMIPTEKRQLQVIKAEVGQRISSAAAAAPRFKEDLADIEAVVLKSIKSKEAAVQAYKEQCKKCLTVRGIKLTQPGNLAAQMGQDLEVLETNLLQTAKYWQKKYHEVTCAVLKTQFKSAVELQRRFTRVGKYFGEESAKHFVRRYNKIDLDANFKLCFQCNDGTYAAELSVCRQLAALSPDFQLVVTEHEIYLANIELAADEGNNVKVRTDALAQLQKVQETSCTKCSKATVDKIIKNFFKKLEADADKGLPSAIGDLTYFQETVKDLPALPWWLNWGPLKRFSVSGKIEELLKECTPEQRSTLPKFALRAEATKWTQDLKAAGATHTVHELVKLLVAPPSHSASEAGVKEAADQCWATIPTTIKSSAVQAIFAQSRDGIRDHLSTILTLKGSRPALPGLDLVVETLQDAARLLAQPPSSMSPYLEGWNVHHTIVLEPEEAKFGCTVKASRFGGSSDVVIVPGVVDFTLEAQSIVEHGKGLRDFQPQHSDVSYGDLILHVTVGGRPETKPLPSGAKVFDSPFGAPTAGGGSAADEDWGAFTSTSSGGAVVASDAIDEGSPGSIDGLPTEHESTKFVEATPLLKDAAHTMADGPMKTIAALAADTASALGATPSKPPDATAKEWKEEGCASARSTGSYRSTDSSVVAGDLLVAATHECSSTNITRSIRKVQASWLDAVEAGTFQSGGGGTVKPEQKAAIVKFLEEFFVIYHNRTHFAKIETLRIPQVISGVVDELLSVVGTVHSSTPPALARATTFVRGVEVCNELAENQQRIEVMEAADQLDAADELKKQIEELLESALDEDIQAAEALHGEKTLNVHNAGSQAMQRLQSMNSTLAINIALLRTFLAEVKNSELAIEANAKRATSALRAQKATSSRRVHEYAERRASARRKADRLLSGVDNIPITEALSQATGEVAKEMKATIEQAREQHCHAGFSETMMSIDKRCKASLVVHADALATTAKMIDYLLTFTSMISASVIKLKAVTDTWLKDVDASFVLVLTAKEELVRQLYVWHADEEVEPALYAETYTRARAAESVNLVKVARKIRNIRDPSAMRKATEDASTAKSKHEEAVQRLATAQAARDHILVKHDYKKLRENLKSKGVSLTAKDPSTTPKPKVDGRWLPSVLPSLAKAVGWFSK